MPFKRDGETAAPSSAHRSRFRGPVFLLILLSVFAQLIFFGQRINLSTGLDHLHAETSLSMPQAKNGWEQLPESGLLKEKFLSQGSSTLTPTVVAKQDLQVSVKVDAAGNNVGSIREFNEHHQNMSSSKEATQIKEVQEGAQLQQKRGVPASPNNNNSNKPRNKQRGSDFLVQTMHDQMATAKEYSNSAIVQNNRRLMRRLKLHMKEIQGILGHAVVDADLPRGASEKISSMSHTLSKVREQLKRCDTAEERLRSVVSAAEEEVRTLKREISFLGELAMRTVPKGLHCLQMQLTVDYYSNSYESEHFLLENLYDLDLYHFVLFTNDVLSASVVINSIIHHAKEPGKHVFHIITEMLNYAAMKMWFLVNAPRNSSVYVENVDNFTVLQKQSTFGSEHFTQFDAQHGSFGSPDLKYRCSRDWRYFTLLQSLPEMYPKLDKIVLLDDDIVVQRDLSPLWNANLDGNIEGTIGPCGGLKTSLDKCLNFSKQPFHTGICGLSLFDLTQWRKQVRERKDKQQLVQKSKRLSEEWTQFSVVTVCNLSHTLGGAWFIADMGESSNLNKELKNAAAVHYHGDKPWLQMDRNMIDSYWTQFVDYQNQFFQKCNINK